MHFPETESLKPFVNSFYNKNVLKFIKQQKEIIYLPKDCSDQMAELVCKHANSKGIKCELKRNSKTKVYSLRIPANKKETPKTEEESK